MDINFDNDNTIFDIYDISENKTKEPIWDPDRFSYLDNELKDPIDLHDIKMNTPAESNGSHFDFNELHCLAKVYNKLDKPARNKISNIINEIRN